MTASGERSSPGIVIYNPDLLSKDALKQQFVARQGLLNRILQDLHDESQSQHRLLVGTRGMGKTTLLRRIAGAVEEDPELSARWLALTFPEEQYNIGAGRLSDLWLNCIDALSDMLEQQGRKDQSARLDAAVDALPDGDEGQRARQSLQLLLDEADRFGKRLLLLIDNLDIVLKRLEAEHWRLREVLAHEPRLTLIGASVEAMEATYEYNGAFYEFFRIHELKGLSETEMKAVLQNLARLGNNPRVEALVDREPARLRTLHVLTGGNPRTIVLLYNVLAQQQNGDVRADLEGLLDHCTPLYKARFEALPAQAQQVVDALALHWDPITAGDLADKLRLPVNTISAQLNRLVQQGVVEKVEYEPSTRTGFQIAERFFNIWYLMRASRRLRRRLIWLVEFMKLLYTDEELAERARKHLQAMQTCAPEQRLYQAELGFALAQNVRRPSLRHALERTALSATLLESDARGLASLLDFEGADAELKPHKERLELLVQIREKINHFQSGWATWSAEEFWRLLCGSPVMSLEEKLRIAEKLENCQEGEFIAIKKELEQKKREVFNAIRSEKTLDQLYEAISRGLMERLDDIDGARAAAEALEDARDLVVVAMTVRLNETFDEALFKEFEQELPGTSCAGPWLFASAHFYENGRIEDSQNAAQQAVGLDPNWAVAWSNLGVLFYFQGQYAEAENNYHHAIKLDSKDVDFWNNLGSLLDNSGRKEEAEDAYRQATELDPTDVNAWNNLGIVLSNSGRSEEAAQAWRHAIKLDPKAALPWNNLGLLLANSGQSEEAERAYRRAIELDPTYFLSWYNLGNLLDDSGRGEEAEQAYRRAIELDSTFASPWYNLGNLLSHSGRSEEAERAYRRAVEFDPKDAGPWNNLGLVLQQLNRHEEAEEAYRKSIQLKKDDEVFKPYHNLANLLYQQRKNLAEAEALAAEATALAPASNQDRKLLYATILTHNGKWPEAESQMRLLLAESDDSTMEMEKMLDFFREAHQTGYAADVIRLLDETGAGERWWPLREALKALAENNPRYLKRVAPEVRKPAERLLEKLNEKYEPAPPGSARTAGQSPGTNAVRK